MAWAGRWQYMDFIRQPVESRPPKLGRGLPVKTNPPQLWRTRLQRREIVYTRIGDALVAAAGPFARRDDIPNTDAQSKRCLFALGITRRRFIRQRGNNFPEMILRMRVVFTRGKRGHRWKTAEHQRFDCRVEQRRQPALSHTFISSISVFSRLTKLAGSSSWPPSASKA